MPERPLLCLFSKVRQEIVREGNIFRMLANAERYVDAAVVLDDGSTDGTDAAVLDWMTRRGPMRTIRYGPARDEPTDEGPRDARWISVLVDPAHPDRKFTRELVWKHRMLQLVHQIQPHFVMWMDGDEVLDHAGTEGGLQRFCLERMTAPEQAWAFHYTQLWRVSTWARIDAGFDDGWFIKLWRYRPELVFYIAPEGTGGWRGLHQAQFPMQIMEAYEHHLVGRAPFEQIHYGNFGCNVKWKAIQYSGGLGGVDRHLRFDKATYRPVDPCRLPEGVEHEPEIGKDHHEADGSPSIALFLPSRPEPFTPDQVTKILRLKNLQGLDDTFTVVIPAYNRADTLARALDSLRAQSYDRWVALVMDDGSVDETPELMRRWQELDPRIFYARYPTNRGGVAMNEFGMAIACEWTSWWTRLGSDDYFGPRKLELDAQALKDVDACYGAYRVWHKDRLVETSNPPMSSGDTRAWLEAGRFVVSWANCAVRTSVLRTVREQYGNFCDPGLRNMEDFLVNARIARHSRGWVWRGVLDGKVIVDPTPQEVDAICDRFEASGPEEMEAVWVAVDTGASGNVHQTARDHNRTLQLIAEEGRRAQRA